MKNPKLLAAVSAVTATAALVTFSPAAQASPGDASSDQIYALSRSLQNLNAETIHQQPVNELPAEGPWNNSEYTSDKVISPKGNTAMCRQYKGFVGPCFQPRSDGRWMPLLHIGPVFLYPVWDDPAAALDLIPAQYRAQVSESLRL